MREPRPFLTLLSLLAIAALVAGCAAPRESVTPDSGKSTNATRNSTTQTPINQTLPTSFNATNVEQNSTALGP